MLKPSRLNKGKSLKFRCGQSNFKELGGNHKNIERNYTSMVLQVFLHPPSALMKQTRNCS